MRLLLIAGTREAVQLSGAIGRDATLSATAVLPGPVRTPIALGIPARIGGWGSDDAFRDWIQRERYTAIVDASHPFARRISRRAAEVASDEGLAYVRFLRKPWLPGEGDDWTFLNECSEVARRIPGNARVLVDTGGRGIHEIGPLPGRKVIFRVSDPPRRNESPPSKWKLRYAPGPYSIPSEEALLASLGVEVLVIPNVGGSEEFPKIEAARRLGVHVAMIRRPPQPEGLKISTVSEVLNWVRRRL